MMGVFVFLNPGELVDGDLSLALVGMYPADSIKKYVPYYEFEMRKVGQRTKMGNIRFRVGSTRRLRYPSHIGYEVKKRYRGHRYAARSCRLLFPLALAHGLRYIWISCAPDNIASRRTCEIAGGKYVDTVCVPKTHEMYARGFRRLRRYRFDLRKVLAKNGLGNE